MHGLIERSKTDGVKVKKIAGGEELTGTIHCGDFGGHWLSKTDLDFTITLTAEAIDASVVARNVGTEAEPMAIAWHPYFNLPSGDRKQVKVHIPASAMARSGRLRQRLPHGQGYPRGGDAVRSARAGGQAAGHGDVRRQTGSRLDWKNGAATVEVIDPEAHYGVKIEGLSKEIKAIQMYAPPSEGVCGHRTPVQLWRSFRQGVGQDRHGDGDAEAGREHQVACADQGVCAVAPRRWAVKKGAGRE